MELVTEETEPVVLGDRNYSFDRKLEENPSGSDLWARFYALDTSFDTALNAPYEIQGIYPQVLQPVWCDMGCVFVDSYNDISRERRCGYYYVISSGENLLNEFRSWENNQNSK